VRPPGRRRLFGSSRASAVLARLFPLSNRRLRIVPTFGSARALRFLELSLLLVLCIGDGFSGVSDEAVFLALGRRDGEFEARVRHAVSLHFLILQDGKCSISVKKPPQKLSVFGRAFLLFFRVVRRPRESSSSSPILVSCRGIADG
jgi:hypothetical protein